MSALDQIAGWPVDHAAAAVISSDGAMLDSYGPTDRGFRLASISKLLSVYAILVAVEEEAVGLDDPAGPESVRSRGATLGHLLAHTSGLGFEAADPVLSGPGDRRVYSNAGIEAAADHLSTLTGIGFSEYLTEAVFEPLGLPGAQLQGSPAHGIWAGVDDLVVFAGELFTPRLIAPMTLNEAVCVQFPGVSGVVPGVGRFDPCDWGYGFERNFGRRTSRDEPHWAGARVSSQTFGHFGGSGTLFFVDPVAQLACVVLTDRPFGAWALETWPQLCDEVVTTYATTVAPSP